MADAIDPQKQPIAAQPVPIPSGVETKKPILPSTSVAIPNSVSHIRNGNLSLDVFSPVNQNGSFDFDRVLRSGNVHIRSRKTKQWKKFFLVLRPNLLSMYKNSSEEKLLKQVNLSDLNAIAPLKDPKGRRQHMFALFSPSRNYHFQANSEEDALEWLDIIRKEAKIDEEEESMIVGSPIAGTQTHLPLGQSLQSDENWDTERLGSSSPEPAEVSRTTTTKDGVRIPGVSAWKTTNHDVEHSGNEPGSTSDFSDAATHGTSATTIPNLALRNVSNVGTTARVPALALAPTKSATTQAPVSKINTELSGVNAEVDEERVIWQGFLQILKSKGGVRQWKRLWVVLRPKNLIFYKNEEEYSALRLIPLSSIISAVEVDPVSRNKAHCMQIIAEDKSYRFAAPSEEALARCLGALKSQLAKRKERQKKQTVA